MTVFHKAVYTYAAARYWPDEANIKELRSIFAMSPGIRFLFCPAVAPMLPGTLDTILGCTPPPSLTHVRFTDVGVPSMLQAPIPMAFRQCFVRRLEILYFSGSGSSGLKPVPLSSVGEMLRYLQCMWPVLRGLPVAEWILSTMWQRPAGVPREELVRHIRWYYTNSTTGKTLSFGTMFFNKWNGTQSANDFIVCCLSIELFA